MDDRKAMIIGKIMGRCAGPPRIVQGIEVVDCEAGNPVEVAADWIIKLQDTLRKLENWEENSCGPGCGMECCWNHVIDPEDPDYDIIEEWCDGCKPMERLLTALEGTPR